MENKTSQQFAEELIGKLRIHSLFPRDTKKCALICIDLLINEYQYTNQIMKDEGYSFEDTLKYYNEIKEIIKKYVI